jgi:O-antigen/teichoic acid export membrane protein
MTISALVSMLDMGFTPTLARNVSYVMGGAKRLQKHGYEIVEQTEEVDYGLLKVIIATSRSIFLLIATVAFVLLAVPGSAYILYVAREQLDRQVVLLAWGVFVFATVLNLFFKFYTPLLQGRGLYASFYKSNALASLVFVSISAVLLLAGFGLLSVALGYLASALVGSWLSRRFLYDATFKTQLEEASVAAVSKTEIFGLMWHNAWRMGLVVIGAFLILRANTLVAAAYLGLATTAAYALTLQVFSVLQSGSTVVFNVQLPKLAKYRVTNQRKALMQTMRFGFGWALILFALGTVILLWMGMPIIRWFGGQTGLLSVPLMAWVGLMMLLELNHSLAAGVIVTGNQVPFVKSALLSGAAIVFLSFIGLKYGGFGVAWLIGTQFVVQLAYNNWKWPWLVYSEFYHNFSLYTVANCCLRILNMSKNK